MLCFAIMTTFSLFPIVDVEDFPHHLDTLFRKLILKSWKRRRHEDAHQGFITNYHLVDALLSRPCSGGLVSGLSLACSLISLWLCLKLRLIWWPITSLLSMIFLISIFSSTNIILIQKAKMLSHRFLHRQWEKLSTASRLLFEGWCVENLSGFRSKLFFPFPSNFQSSYEFELFKEMCPKRALPTRNCMGW